MTERTTQKTHTFRGFNNVADPLRLGLSWQTQVDNVDITNRGGLDRCSGFTRRLTASLSAGAYATEDLQRLYVIDAGALKRVFPNYTTKTIYSGLSAGAFDFVEVNGEVFMTNGVDYLVIDRSDRVWPWGITPPATPTLALGSGVLKAGTYQVVATRTDARGIESGNSQPAVLVVPDGSQIAISNIQQDVGYETNAYVTQPDGTVYFLLAEDVGSAVSYNCGPDALGRELPFWELDPPRGNDHPELFAGRLYLSEWFPEYDTSVIWASWPMHYHHFDYGEDSISIPGKTGMVGAVGEALIIGTDRAIFSYDGQKLTQLADYGVVYGWHGSEFEGQLYFWSLRGLCRALPFANLTENTFSVPPGLSASGMMIQAEGSTRYVVALHKGGEAYNRRNT